MLVQKQRQGKNNQNKSSKISQCSKSIELQINISIGKNKYLLQVQKCSNLHHEVEIFLETHGLNAKYQGPILAMVRQQLAKKNNQKQNPPEKIQQLHKIKNQIDNKRKMVFVHEQKQQIQQNQQKDQLWNNCKKSDTKCQKKQDKQNNSSQFNIKHGVSAQTSDHNNIKQSQKSQNKQHQQDKKCQNVYQKWKVKQKIKEKQRVKNAKTPKKLSKQKGENKSFIKEQDRSKSKNKLQTHEPDYFYSKGQKFKYAKEIHVQNLYKQKYPFQIHRQISLTPKKKAQLHQRLFKQHKIKQTLKIEKQIQQNISSKPKIPTDKYKQKVLERDNKLNQALGYLLQNKMIQNPYKIEKVSKSPFRKTNCY